MTTIIGNELTHFLMGTIFLVMSLLYHKWFVCVCVWCMPIVCVHAFERACVGRSGICLNKLNR